MLKQNISDCDFSKKLFPDFDLSKFPKFIFLCDTFPCLKFPCIIFPDKIFPM